VQAPALCLTYYPGRARLSVTMAWMGINAWWVYGWFELAGMACLLVASTRWLRRALRAGARRQMLHADALDLVWVTPWVLCVQVAAQAQPLWLWQSELPASEWAQLRRWLYLRNSA